MVSYHKVCQVKCFINMLTANYEYSRSNSENLPLPVQMQLSEKPKTFLESTLNFEHFEKK